MSKMEEYKELLAIHPGCFVDEIIEEWEMNQAEFAVRMGTTPKTVSKLVNGQINISNDLAKKLSVMTGISVQTWLNMQTSYEEKLIEIQKERDYDEQLYMRDLIDCLNIAGSDNIADEDSIESLCRTLRLADLRILESNDFLVDYEKEGIVIEKQKRAGTRAWMQIAMNKAYEENTGAFNYVEVKKLYGEMIKAGTELQTYMDSLRNSGIALIMLAGMKNSSADCVVKWLNASKVMVAVNQDSENVDRAILYGIEHALKQKIKKVFMMPA